VAVGVGSGSSAFELIPGQGAPVSVDDGDVRLEPVEALRGRARRLAELPRLQVLRALETSARGLTEAEADERAAVYGENQLSWPEPPGRRRRWFAAASNPFVVLLTVLAGVAGLTGSPVGAAVVFLGAVVSCGLRVQQERRGEHAAAALRAMVCATATVLRRSEPGADSVARETPVAALVPGDVVRIAAGDLVPADLYLLAAADLAISEWVLTGESRPAAKHAAPTTAPTIAASISAAPISAVPIPSTPSAIPTVTAPENSWLCLMGGAVAHGAGTGVVIATGGATVFGAAHAGVSGRPAEGAFDRSARRVTWMLLAFMAVTVPAVLILAARAHGLPAPVLEFALAVAVGLTPEMLPVVITAVLARAARVLAEEGTVVRRLPAVHDLAAMDTLCIDKTGTLTEGRPVVIGSVDPWGEPAEDALSWAVAISEAAAEHVPGLAGVFDQALAEAAPTTSGPLGDERDLRVLDVLPFDPARRRVSALLRDPSRLGSVILATHGAVAEVLDACADIQVGPGNGSDTRSDTRSGTHLTGDFSAAGTTTTATATATATSTTVAATAPLTVEDRARLLDYAAEQAESGSRLLAVAIADLPPRRAHAPLRPADERGLTLVGFVALRDQAKPTAQAAIADLADLGVRVAVLTGDAPEVAARVCREIGLDPGTIATGDRIDACDAPALIALAARTSVFARVDPGQKARVVAALQAGGRVVGFLGDGVNDAPALRTADVGIAVRDGAELARECAQVVLGDKDLAGLARAVADSRRAVVNAIKYLRITISSNLGNALSMALAVLVLPFLPMLPLQVLAQNLCFDLCQLALARDRVDPATARRPRRLTARDPALFALVFGPLNTIADLAAFAALHYVLTRAPGGWAGPTGQAAFHAGWFAENLLTQALAIFLLRARRASRSGRPAWPVVAAGGLLAVIGLALPMIRLGAAVGFAGPPASFYPILGLIVVGYCLAVVAVKAGYGRLRPLLRPSQQPLR
jgi:Mg2+-importing ATPase